MFTAKMFSTDFVTTGVPKIPSATLGNPREAYRRYFDDDRGALGHAAGGTLIAGVRSSFLFFVSV
jgi:hypothetical protein